MSNTEVFNHSKLDAYNVSVEFVAWCHVQEIHASVKNQLIRASESVALNIAEGCGQLSTAMMKKHYRIAFASAAECSAALDLIALHRKDVETGKQLVERIGLGGCPYCLPVVILAIEIIGFVIRQLHATNMRLPHSSPIIPISSYHSVQTIRTPPNVKENDAIIKKEADSNVRLFFFHNQVSVDLL